jgi:hypothetical protein
MIFTKWPLVMLMLIWTLSAIFIGLVRKTNKWIRRPVRVILSLVVAVLGLSIALLTLPTGCFSESKLIYSPDRSKAARIFVSDEGALGGSSTISVFWNHGLSTKAIFSGSWKSAEEKDIEWISNDELRISYVGYMNLCQSAANVKVQCVSKDKPPTP